ncbi:cytochrome P450 [Bimuria novae-zelandiae CBS 107.79]|uniref:Cytochrome P450 n=1 Tax=Bimuria novae-zelandiae CBS 107.79 TaxID=1447943 RepID=A0A6A5VRF2_9PLEO|nr:cytochrome P450 [Bimuria novae-zelandiae CBS 107.79]
MASNLLQYSSWPSNQYETRTAIAYAILAAAAISVVHYSVTLALYNATPKKVPPKSPPLLPHFLPLIGSFPWKYFTDPIRFFTTGYLSLVRHPIRVRLLGHDFYIIQGSDHVLSHLSQTSTSNTIFNANFLRQACGMSDKAVDRLGSESEETPKYFELKKYLAAAPLYAWSSSVIHRYLAGRGAHKLSQRFEANLRDRIRTYQEAAVGDGIVLSNFQDFFTEHVTAALLDSMCGTGLLAKNPGVTQAFWIFCDSLPTYMKHTPRILAPKAYKAREEVIAAVQVWQTWASENFDADTTPLDEDGDDPFWGSKFFRERFSTFVFEMGFDPRDMASMEVGFLFGASANVTANTYWCVIDVFRDHKLLNDIRAEVRDSTLREKGAARLDINVLVQQPILQAVFAESLRLRCHVMFIRKTTQPTTIVDWLIPKDRFLIAWSTPGHMDSKLWSHSNDVHPVDTFWPGRFLKYTSDSERPTFSLPGTEGSWLPFGYGANLCPGRQFAKVHCLVTLALMVGEFECDILASSKDLKLDLSKFGIGVLGPSGTISARLRKRDDRG